MRKIIFFVSCFFIMINTVRAVSMNCPSAVSPGELFEIYLEEDNYNGLKLKYDFAEGFIYQDVSFGDSLKSYYDGINGFSVGNVQNGNKLTMSIKVKVNTGVRIDNEYTLKLTNIEGNDKDYKFIKLDDVSCALRVVSDINTLDSLVVDGVTLNPGFDKNVVSYSGVTTKDKVTIRATASDKDSKVYGDIGEKRLDIGVNTFSIKVVSVRGNEKEYKVYITRNDVKKNSDITLKSLTISNGKLNFKKDTFLYSVSVGSEVESVDVVAVPNDEKASVEIIKSDTLSYGENTIKVIVTAEDGTKGTYVINLNRANKLSGDATIRYLNIKNYNINFSSDVYEYDLFIDGERKLDIDVTLNDEKAKYTIVGNRDLKDGSVISIKVVAEDASELVYMINVFKKDESNSGVINDYIKLVPLVCFVILVVGILVIKLVKGRVAKEK